MTRNRHSNFKIHIYTLQFFFLGLFKGKIFFFVKIKRNNNVFNFYYFNKYFQSLKSQFVYSTTKFFFSPSIHYLRILIHSRSNFSSSIECPKSKNQKNYKLFSFALNVFAILRTCFHEVFNKKKMAHRSSFASN